MMKKDFFFQTVPKSELDYVKGTLTETSFNTLYNRLISQECFIKDTLISI